jgi:hypothetical protein
MNALSPTINKFELTGNNYEMVPVHGRDAKPYGDMAVGLAKPRKPTESLPTLTMREWVIFVTLWRAAYSNDPQIAKLWNWQLLEESDRIPSRPVLADDLVRCQYVCALRDAVDRCNVVEAYTETLRFGTELLVDILQLIR